MSNYRCCAVPQCTSSTVKTPGKLYIHVPLNWKIRVKWLNLARRDPNASRDAQLYFCEDHFDLPTDMTNYMQYSLMGSVKRIQMREGCLPSKFECQTDRRKRTLPSENPRSTVVKRNKLSSSHECQNILQQYSNQVVEAELTIADEGVLLHTEMEECPSANKIIQVDIKPSFRSKAVQCGEKTKSVSTSPIKPSMQSISTSPLKFRNGQKTSRSADEEVSKMSSTEEELSDSDTSTYRPNSSDCTSDATFSDEELHQKMFRQQSLQLTMMIVKKKPRFYLGIPEECYFLVDIIEKHTNISKKNILLCLKKIRLDTTFSELGDNFGISLSYASKVFLKNIPKIAAALQPFIHKANKAGITRNLPIAFRYNYHRVSHIIDCFEIDIQKPSKPVHQALTWSAYKSGNTMKYFIVSTPDGIITYISPGYSGRISDNLLIEECKFLDWLEPGDVVLADRGFKHIEEQLSQKGVELQRPPTVESSCKLTKLNVRKTREIACLRIHIERVVRRVREFSMLRQHSGINTNLIRILDQCVIIACALINLQNPLIK